MSVRVIVGDCIARLRELPVDSVHCCVTSVPYWGLRQYIDDGAPEKPFEIGLEPTPEAWTDRLVEVFREVRRVLRPDGVCFVNIGDSYCAHPNQRSVEDKAGPKQRSNGGSTGCPSRHVDGLKPKDLVGQPWLLAFALRADGWWLRSEIIWAKPNPMPESVRDRPTKAHETVFLLTKSGETTFWVHRDLPGVRSRPEPDYRWVHKRTGEEVAEDPGDPDNWKRINLWRGRDYFWDAEAVREPNSETPGAQAWRRIFDPSKQGKVAELKANGFGGGQDGERNPNPAGRNLRSVWTIATEPFPEAHFATFPTELPRRCILAGTSAKGCCPQCGAPWARVVEDTGYSKHRPSAGNDPRSRAEDHFAQANGSSGWRGNNLLKNPPTTTGWRATCACDAGDPVPATILDPFGGSGTTGLVADQLGRDAILIELSPEYAAMAERRIQSERARRAIGEVSERVKPMPGQAELFA